MVSCWTRKDRTYVDLFNCRHRRDVTSDRWDGLAADQARPPLGSTVLTKVHTPSDVSWLARRRRVCFWIFRPGTDEEICDLELTANDDGLFA